jgi:hypothetical protein
MNMETATTKTSSERQADLRKRRKEAGQVAVTFFLSKEEKLELMQFLHKYDHDIGYGVIQAIRDAGIYRDGANELFVLLARLRSTVTE